MERARCGPFFQLHRRRLLPRAVEHPQLALPQDVVACRKLRVDERAGCDT
jgi:hypothetical protein